MRRRWTVIGVAVVLLLGMVGLGWTFLGGSSSPQPQASATKKDSEGPASPAPTDFRGGLPSTSVKPPAEVSYAAASSVVTKTFAPVKGAEGGLVTRTTLHVVRLAGKPSGGVGVYAVKPGLSKSTVFQDQYVSQLMKSITKETAPPKSQRINGQVVQLSHGKIAVAGWFEGDDVVLVWREADTPNLPDLAAGVHAQRAGR